MEHSRPSIVILSINKEIVNFVVTVNIFLWFIIETTFLVAEGGSRRWVKIKRTERRIMMNLKIWSWKVNSNIEAEENKC